MKSRTIASDSNADINRLKLNLIHKSQRLKDISHRKKEAKAMIERLEGKRLALEKEIDRLSADDQSEMKDIGSDVQAFRHRKKVAKHRYQVLESDLMAKRELVSGLQSSEEQKSYSDLTFARANLKRRVAKWNLLLQDTKESMRKMEAYSEEHREKRTQLRDKVKANTKKKLSLEEELTDTDNYKQLLVSILKEHEKHWLL